MSSPRPAHCRGADSGQSDLGDESGRKSRSRLRTQWGHCRPQSVDLQAAAPHPPALPLPSPAPHQDVTKTDGLLRGPTQDGEGRAARCMAWYVHQVATEHRTSEVGVGGQGRAADRGVRGPCPFCFIQAARSDHTFPHPLLRAHRDLESQGHFPQQTAKWPWTIALFLDGEEKPGEALSAASHIRWTLAASLVWINELAD